MPDTPLPHWYALVAGNELAVVWVGQYETFEQAHDARPPDTTWLIDDAGLEMLIRTAHAAKKEAGHV